MFIYRQCIFVIKLCKHYTKNVYLTFVMYFYHNHDYISFKDRDIWWSNSSLAFRISYLSFIGILQFLLVNLLPYSTLQHKGLKGWKISFGYNIVLCWTWISWNINFSNDKRNAKNRLNSLYIVHKYVRIYLFLLR